MKVLLVEDDHRISSSIRSGLEQEGMTVDVAFNGETGLEMGLSDGYDLIILDIMLPLLDGNSLCKELRDAGIQTAVLMLTAKTTVQDTVTGLENGADDYLAKPFAFDELLARMKALSRRPRKQQAEIISFADLVVDKHAFSVTRAGKPIAVSKREFLLLVYLLENKNTTVTKEQIITHVWEFDTDVLPNTVEVYIGYLRNKLEKPFKKSPKIISTVRGFGYTIATDAHPTTEITT